MGRSSPCWPLLSNSDKKYRPGLRLCQVFRFTTEPHRLLFDLARPDLAIQNASSRLVWARLMSAGKKVYPENLQDEGSERRFTDLFAACSSTQLPCRFQGKSSNGFTRLKVICSFPACLAVKSPWEAAATMQRLLGIESHDMRSWASTRHIRVTRNLVCWPTICQNCVLARLDWRTASPDRSD